MEEIESITKKFNDELEKYGVDESKVIDTSNKALNEWNGYYRDNITAGRRDSRFLSQDQWEANERAEFTRTFKVCLTSNRLADTVNKLISEQREMNPELMVRSLNGIASQEEISLRTDLVRSISYHSTAKTVYQQCFANQMQFSYGAFQVYVDYESPNSFRRVIRYDSIQDPTSVFFDPIAKDPHKGDGNYCGRLLTMSLEEFKATYPWIQNPTSYASPQILNNRMFKSKDMVVICDFFQKEWFSKMLYELDDHREVDEFEWEKIKEESNKISKITGKNTPSGRIIMRSMPKIIRERKSEDYRIIHYRMIKNQIIDFAEWESKYLPIVFAPGRQSFLDGKEYVKSFISDARDTQKFLNYAVSEIATEMKNRRREQWLVTSENIIGNEFQWRNPEIQQGALKFNPDKKGFIPQKLPSSEIPQTLTQQVMRASQDIKEILGFYEANLGKAGGELSGVAIQNRATQGNLSAVIFFDNLNQAIAQGGKIVLDLLPVVYGDERTVILSNAAGESRNVFINKKMPDGSIENPVLKGDYDIEISTGPSFAIQKAQSLEMFIKLAQLAPDKILPLVADLIAKNLDIEDQQRLVKRLELLVPPKILAEEKGMEPPPEQPDPSQQMMQMQQMMAQKQLEERAEELRIRQEKHELEKVKLAMEAKELQDKLSDSSHRRETELQKADMDFTAKIASILKDLHK
jgi:hypothetical protein